MKIPWNYLLVAGASMILSIPAAIAIYSNPDAYKRIELPAVTEAGEVSDSTAEPMAYFFERVVQPHHAFLDYSDGLRVHLYDVDKDRSIGFADGFMVISGDTAYSCGVEPSEGHVSICDQVEEYDGLYRSTLEQLHR